MGVPETLKTRVPPAVLVQPAGKMAVNPVTVDDVIVCSSKQPPFPPAG